MEYFLEGTAHMASGPDSGQLPEKHVRPARHSHSVLAGSTRMHGLDLRMGNAVESPAGAQNATGRMAGPERKQEAGPCLDLSVVVPVHGGSSNPQPPSNGSAPCLHLSDVAARAALASLASNRMPVQQLRGLQLQPVPPSCQAGATHTALGFMGNEFSLGPAQGISTSVQPPISNPAAAPQPLNLAAGNGPPALSGLPHVVKTSGGSGAVAGGGSSPPSSIWGVSSPSDSDDAGVAVDAVAGSAPRLRRPHQRPAAGGAGSRLKASSAGPGFGVGKPRRYRSLNSQDQAAGLKVGKKPGSAKRQLSGPKRRKKAEAASSGEAGGDAARPSGLAGAAAGNFKAEPSGSCDEAGESEEDSDGSDGHIVVGRTRGRTAGKEAASNSVILGWSLPAPTAGKAPTQRLGPVATFWKVLADRGAALQVVKGDPISRRTRSRLGVKPAKAAPKGLAAAGDTPLVTPGQDGKRKRRRKKVPRGKDSASREGSRSKWQRLCNRVKTQLHRIKQEEHTISVFAADGWRGASREKVRLTAQLQRAQQASEKAKEAIRDCIRQCENDNAGQRTIPDNAYDEEGEVDAGAIVCSACDDFESYDENDIIMCDGCCNRAFHERCCNPPVRIADLAEDEGWLCPACECKADIVSILNDEFNTEYNVETPWQEVLVGISTAVLASPRGASMPGKGQRDGDAPTLLDVEWPSDDEEEDEDYSGRRGRRGGARAQGGSPDEAQRKAKVSRSASPSSEDGDSKGDDGDGDGTGSEAQRSLSGSQSPNGDSDGSGGDDGDEGGSSDDSDDDSSGSDSSGRDSEPGARSGSAGSRDDAPAGSGQGQQDGSGSPERVKSSLAPRRSKRKRPGDAGEPENDDEAPPMAELNVEGRGVEPGGDGSAALAAPPADGSGSSSESESSSSEEEDLILNYKRRRVPVDYLALHREMYGEEEDEGEDEDDDEDESS